MQLIYFDTINVNGSVVVADSGIRIPKRPEMYMQAHVTTYTDHKHDNNRHMK
eukprot:m.217633 g.217633  ORF g.217633 m.217633 type:complete len:52 (+) comp19133_c0_seq4:1207-1362(+)